MFFLETVGKMGGSGMDTLIHWEKYDLGEQGGVLVFLLVFREVPLAPLGKGSLFKRTSSCVFLSEAQTC